VVGLGEPCFVHGLNSKNCPSFEKPAPSKLTIAEKGGMGGLETTKGDRVAAAPGPSGALTFS
jgi:hypothetical protein